MIDNYDDNYPQQLLTIIWHENLNFRAKVDHKRGHEVLQIIIKALPAAAAAVQCGHSVNERDTKVSAVSWRGSRAVNVTKFPNAWRWRRPRRFHTGS